MDNLLYFSDSTRQMFSMNPSTFSYAQGPTLSVVMTDLAIAPDGRLFGVSFSSLYSIDQATGQATLIGDLGSPSSANALTFDAFGTLYMASGNGLYTVNTSTGTSTLLGNTGFSSAGDLAFHDGQLWLSATNRSLVRLDPTTGAAITSIQHGINELYGLVSTGGDVYGFAGTDVYRINLTTGNSVIVSTLSSPVPSTINGATTDGFGQNGLVLRGNDSNNNLRGSSIDDIIYGFSGQDNLTGLAGEDLLFGGLGGDNLWGGAGADSHIGGDDAGLDFARYDDANYGNLTIRLDAPNLNVGAVAFGDTYSGIEGLVGGSGNDTVVGNASNNFLFGAGGGDFIYGLGGNDYLNGGAGGDNLYGGAGADSHIGGDDAGIDYARYDDANYGNLTIRLDAPGANAGSAAIGDTYTGIEGLVGGLGNDTVVGNGSANYLFGGGGTDLIYGFGGADYLNGGLGGDNLYGGAGADSHIGGDDAGIDYARYDDANYGNLTIRLDAPGANAGSAAIGDTYTGIEGLVGGLGNDTVVGNASNNFLFGGGGGDFIYGLGGNDYLNGGAGGDQLYGGTGADSHIGGDDAGIDYARYDDANYGNLTIRLDAPGANAGAAAIGDTYTGIEGLVGGAGVDVVVGNALANYLFGGGNTDYLYGASGNDYLNGGAGADRFVFNTALNASTNVDTIADFVVGVDDIQLSTSIFSAVGATLTADEFRIGSALDANDFILYNNITGALYYDSNGNVAGGITQFATVTAGTALTAGDFLIA